MAALFVRVDPLWLQRLASSTALGMDVVGDLKSKKALYKVFLYILKTIPMLMAFCDILNTVLYLLGIDAWWLSYIGGVSIMTIVFLYISSYVFQFCEYHRMFLHYIVCNNIISSIDYYYELCISGIIYLIIAGIFLFFILYLHQKEIKNNRI